MKSIKNVNIDEYTVFLNEIKESIKAKQLEAFRSVNHTLIELYWHIGKKIVEKQKQVDWGNSVIKMLSDDLQKEFPGIA